MRNRESGLYPNCYNHISFDVPEASCFYIRNLFPDDADCPGEYHRVLIDLNSEQVLSYETDRDEIRGCGYPD